MRAREGTRSRRRSRFSRTNFSELCMVCHPSHQFRQRRPLPHVPRPANEAVAGLRDLPIAKPPIAGSPTKFSGGQAAAHPVVKKGGAGGREGFFGRLRSSQEGAEVTQIRILSTLTPQQNALCQTTWEWVAPGCGWEHRSAT